MVLPGVLKLALIGDPVEHSASPALQRAFLAEAGIAGRYDAIRVAAGNGAREVAALRAAGYTGLNVTTPLKEEAFACVDECDATARALAAVNTIVFLARRSVGYNTDGAGALGALVAAGLADVEGRDVLVLGAGPTARAAVVALVAARARVVLWNRTRERAELVAQKFGAAVWDVRSDRRIDAVFSALPPGVALEEDLARACVRTPVIVDANYADRATLGRTLDREVTDGLAMLHASARASFELFRTALRTAAAAGHEP